jgi:hypothetical protein
LAPSDDLRAGEPPPAELYHLARDLLGGKI